MSDELRVYSQPSCPGCDSLKKRLHDQGIPFAEVRIDQDPEALHFLKLRGIRTVPAMFRNGEQVKML